MRYLKFPLMTILLLLMFSTTLTYADDTNVEYLVDNVDRFMTVNIPRYGIFIDNEPIGYLESKEEADAILETLKTMYLDEGTNPKEIRFKQEVQVLKDAVRAIDQDSLYTQEEMLDYIVRGTNERRTHTVEKGENYWVISEQYGISPNDLVIANPGVVPERLQIGQEISLIVPKPLITVVTVEEATYTEKIQYDVAYENSSAYYQGDYRTKRSGVYGELEVVAMVYKENGIESDKEIISETVVKEPTTKIVYRGTKDPPPRIGTGTFGYPYDTSRGYITSSFGMRYHPIYREYRRHTGIDIGLPTGSLVYAADGGKVIYSGYKGGYGLMIQIDHGANIETIYGHLSKSYVSVGDMVYKGQKIALSGNTGTSTGPHLHFEVRKIGVPVEPDDYINVY